MATAKQKKAAAKNRANAAKALKAAQAKKKAAIKAVKSAKKGSKAHKAALAKLAKVKSVATKRASKVKAISKIMKEKTTEKATTSGSVKHTLTKIKRDDAKAIRDKAVKKMQALKPGSAAWKKARRNVVTASSNVRKHGNVMRGISGREMGERTSYTGPRQSMRDYIRSIEASKGGKNLTKLNEETKWSKLNKQMLDEMEGKTYAEKRDNWNKKWGEPGSDSYKEMQKIQEQRFKAAYPDADPNVDTSVDDGVDVTVDGPNVVGVADGGPYSGAGTGRGFGRDRLAARGGYAPGFFGGNPGILNYATPGFLGSEALNPYFSNYENWSQFMPTNYSLAAQGGALYQPGQYWGGARSGLYGTGGVLPVSGGTGPGGGYYPPGGGGLYPPGGGGGGVGGGGVTYTPPGTGPVTGGGAPTTGVIPGSDKANDLASGRTHHPEMYDQNDMWVGAEGAPESGGYRSVGPLGNQQGYTGEIFSNNTAWDNPNNYDSQANVMPNTGYTPGYTSNPLAEKQAFMDSLSTQGGSTVNPNYTGPLVDDFSNMPTVAPGVNTSLYTSSLDDSQMRTFNSMTPAQQQAAARAFNQAGGGQAGAEAALGEINLEINKSGGWDSQVG